MAQKSQYYSSFVKALWLEELAVGHGPTVMPRDHCSLGFLLLVTRVPGGCPGTSDVLSRTELCHQLILETSSSLCAVITCFALVCPRLCDRDNIIEILPDAFILLAIYFLMQSFLPLMVFYGPRERDGKKKKIE